MDTNSSNPRLFDWPGSVPQDMDPTDAMNVMCEKVGPYMHALPWETDPDWIIRWLKALAEHPDIEVVKEGGWTGYDDMTRYRVKRPDEGFREELIRVGIVQAWHDGVEHYLKLRERFGFPAKTPFKIGVKSPLNFDIFAFGLYKTLSYRLHVVPFIDATVREMKEVAALAAQRKVHVEFQLEFPGELIAEVTLAVAPMRRAFTGLVVASLHAVIRQAPRGPFITLRGHTCPGRWYNKPKVQPRSTAPLVALVNGLFRGWPPEAPMMTSMNLPFGAGCHPPTLREEFYRPLVHLRVPASVELVAGVLHEDLALPEVELILRTAEGFINKDRTEAPVRLAVGPTCGSGQMNPHKFMDILDVGAGVCGGVQDRQCPS